jgi:O-antigen ligase
MIAFMTTKPAVQTTSKLAAYMAVTVLAVLFLLPFHAFITTWAGANFGYLDQFRIWKEIIIFFLGFGCLVLLIRDRSLRRQFLSSKITILIGLYVLLALLRTAYGYSEGITNFEAAAYGAVAGLRYLIFFLVVGLVASRGTILQRWWPFAVVAPATTVVFFGLLQQLVLDKNFLTHFGYGPDTIPAFQGVDQKTEYARAQSTLRGPNPLGAYLALVITFLTGLTYRFRTYWFSFGFLAVAATALLFFSYSRSAWIGLVISLATWILLVIRNEKVLKLLIIVGLATAVIVGASVYVLRDNDYVQNTIFHTDENSQSATSTNSVRTQAIQDGLSDVWHHPLGQGLGSAGPASTRNSHPKIAENYYIQVAQEVGIFGLVLYLAITIGVGYKLLEQRSELLPQVLFATLIGISVINLVSHAWMDDTLSLLWWGLAGIALTPIIKHKHEKQTKSEKLAR